MRHTYYKMIGGEMKSDRLTLKRALEGGWSSYPAQAVYADRRFYEVVAECKLTDRDTLRKLAAELDIPGRSTMNKEQLVEAVARKRCGRQ